MSRRGEESARSVRADTIEEAAKANGISQRTLFRAKKELNVAKNADDGKWRWEMTPS
jgi:hypothetical protein